MRRINSTDVVSGLMFISIGIATIVLSQEYPIGFTIRMGPGYFPTALGGLLIALGTLICVSAFFTEPIPVARWRLRPVFTFALSAIAFGVGMEVLRIGLAPSLLIATVIASSAQGGTTWFGTLLSCACIVAFCVLVFVIGLGLPYSLFWWN